MEKLAFGVILALLLSVRWIKGQMPVPPTTTSKTRSDEEPVTVIQSITHGPLSIDVLSPPPEASLPPPEALAEYERLAPGAAKRIIELALNRSKLANQIAIEEKRNNIRARIAGTLAVIVLIVIASTAVFTISGNSFTAAISVAWPMLATIMGAVVGFYFGKETR